MLRSPRDVQPGDVLADRYTVLEFAAQGGMGAVFRGTDAQTETSVAIKFLASEQPGHVNRFSQEVALLSRLSHPAIVRYLASGRTEDGLPYLVMEWLEGQTLRQHLAKASLSVAEAVTVARRTCEALAVAHAAQIIHRDLKPSNLFLVGGECAQLKVLDFGIARQQGGRTLTQSGAVLGTVGYMSPEQAMGTGWVDQRADLFSIGCILYECLAGRAAFTGDNPVAILAKILRADPPALGQLRADVDGGLQTLVDALLAKDASARPPDTAAVLEALATVKTDDPAPHPERATAIPRLTTSERKVVAVILGQPRQAPSEIPTAGALDTMDAYKDAPAGGAGSVAAIAQSFGLEATWLCDGSLMLVTSALGEAADQSAQAARCALALQQTTPALRLCVATGRVETSAQVPIGGAVDRAAARLGALHQPAAGVAIDDTTAALLEQSFVIQCEESGCVVVAERAERSPARKLLGEPTPFLGRRKELSLLERTLAECVEDSVARVVLVTGPPGQGKSRLRHEFVAGLRESLAPKVLLVQADPTDAGASLLLVRKLVRQAANLKDDASMQERRGRLAAYLASLCRERPESDARLLREFLGELVGAPSSGTPSTELRAARNDAQIMGTWLSRAFTGLLAAECARQPVLLILEDLHWGDTPSLAYMDKALRELDEQPLMVLALARPELEQSVPRLWANAESQLVRLGRLTRRAAEQLIHSALGERLRADVDLAALVERADGNPFHLEELIRRVAEGDPGTLPETVLALLQSRLDRLSPSARRFIRAGSLFGETFWAGGVCEVLGESPLDGSESAQVLRALLHDEVVALRHESRFHDEQEYNFSHGLLREAAYATLTEEDRLRGHLLAGLWLVRMGAKDARTIARHFELAKAPDRALPWLLIAAREAADGGDVDAAVRLAEQGLHCGPTGETAGQLYLVQAEAHVMRADWHRVIASGRAASAALTQGSASWFTSVAAPLIAATFVGDTAYVIQTLQQVLSSPLPREATAAVGQTVSWAILALLNASQMDAATALLDRAWALTSDEEDVDPLFLMWLHTAQGYHLVLQRNLGGALTALDKAQAIAQRTQAVAGGALSGMCRVIALSQTGHGAQTAAAARETRAFSAPSGLSLASDWATYYEAIVRSGGAWQDLQTEVVEPALKLLQGSDHRLLVSARALLAVALMEQGKGVEAEEQAALAVAEARFPLEQAVACSAMAHVALHLEQHTPALEHAERGLAASRTGLAPRTYTMMQLDRARALHGLGRRDAAQQAIAEARDEVLRVAATLPEGELHTAFLEHVEVNRLVLELAAQWLGDT